ncbi:hypothetical protein [Nocardioides nanhaiensis]|uniref:Uncharacterized protein n=1 Tax=Nocardioides nanhaiensis TaxID=1476871 RepID=A0ABP8W3G5_9ACTN
MDRDDLVIPEGTTWARGWRVTYNGAPIGPEWTTRAQIRARAGGADVLHTFAADVVDGCAVIAADPDETLGWTWDLARYDVTVTSPDGVVIRVAEGRAVYRRGVTRDE